MPTIKVSGIVLIILVVVIIAAHIFLPGIVSTDIAAAALGIIGVGGFAGLRAMINSSGNKTYILAIGGAVAVGLFAFQIIPVETYSWLMMSVLGLQSGSIGSAINKTPTNEDAIKKVA